MRVHVPRWDYGHDHYYGITAFLAARGAQTATCRLVAAFILLFGFIPVLLIRQPCRTAQHGRADSRIRGRRMQRVDGAHLAAASLAHPIPVSGLHHRGHDLYRGGGSDHQPGLWDARHHRLRRTSRLHHPVPHRPAAGLHLDDRRRHPRHPGRPGGKRRHRNGGLQRPACRAGEHFRGRRVRDGDPTARRRGIPEGRRTRHGSAQSRRLLSVDGDAARLP